jgi:hypothetical protein
MTRTERDAMIDGIRRSARIWELRRLAAQTSEVFINAQRAGWTRAQVMERMLAILDEQRDRD